MIGRGRSAAPSALSAVGGFGVAVAALSVAATASVVLLMPDPPAVRVTVADAAAALRGQPTALDRQEGDPPEGPPALLVRPVLARALGRRETDVRAVWLDPPASSSTRIIMMPGARPLPQGSTMIVGRTRAGGPPPNLIINGPPSTAWPRSTIQSRQLIDGLILTLPQPAFAASVRAPDGRWITVAPRRPLLGGWRLKVLAALAISLLLLAPLAWLFARRLTRPFRALATAIERGTEPPRPAGPRELREAAGAIVRLRARLAADADERMRMLTAVAHDLRTPLTSLRLRIESAPEPQRSRMVADADRMGAMIDDVLAFARLADAARQPVAVRALAADVLADMPDADGRVVLDPGPDASVMVVEPAFRRAVENLVRNALVHAGGGRIAIAREDDAVVLAVIDGGPGIPAEDRARMVRPFERGEASRSRDTGGVGLGLSIVQSFADLHDGALILEDAPGGGTAAMLRLPAASRTR